LEMLSMCTGYSRLHWRWFEYVSPCSCTFHVLNEPRVRLFHISVFYWHTCHLTTGQCVIFLIVHVAVSYLTTCHGAGCPCFIFYLAMWFDDFLLRIGFLFAHTSCHGYFTCHALVRPRVTFLFDHVVCPGSTTYPTINSS
jgi:hypothetical protein